jgi:hypothetical protein
MEKIGSRKWLKVWMLIFVLAALPFIAGCGSGTSEPAFNITGNWNIFTTTSGAIGELGPNLFSFTTSASTLAGTTPQGNVISGTISDLNISFSWVGSDGFKNSYTGVVSNNGTTMAGTWTSTDGHSGTWNGIIISTTNSSFPPNVNIAGNWNAFLTTAGTPGEQGPDVVTFTQSANNLGGSVQGQQITGSIMSSNITSLIFFFNDGISNFAFTGIVSTDGHSMSGTWTNTGGQTGTWRATKS